MMATATRGSDSVNREAELGKDAAPRETTFDFLIRPNIPLPIRNGYFPRCGPQSSIAAREGPVRKAIAGPMPKYVIERDIPNVGSVTGEQVIAISQKSCSVLDKLGAKIQWLHSYVTQDKIYCVYIAPNEEMVREHARQGGFPANRVSEVKMIIDPTSAQA
jgi:hypothetical protein